MRRGQGFLTSFVTHTLSPLLTPTPLFLSQGWTKKAEKLAKECKLPEATLWGIRVRCLAGSRDWAALADYAAKNHSRGGYAPYARIAMELGALTEAKKYALKTAEPEARFELLRQLGALPEAIETALKARDAERLLSLQGHPALTQAGEEALGRALAQLRR
jgi:hypothetical protein